MDEETKGYIDRLLQFEGYGLLNWSDRSQLANYRTVYPNYFKTEAQIDKAIGSDMEHQRHGI